MPSNKNFSRRIELLDSLLSYGKWTFSELMSRLNDKLIEFNISVSRRTIFQDLNFLEFEKSAPLHRATKSNPYYYYKEKFSLKNLPIDQEEVEYLRDAIKILKQVNSFNILTDVEAILQKLENKIETNIPDRNSIIQFEQQETTAGNEHIENLFTAIKNKNVIKLTYQPFNSNDPKESLEHPYLIKEFRNRWFLFGRIDKQISHTTFALDRIKKIRNATTNYCENDIFNSDTFFNSLIGVTFPNGEQEQKIKIKISKDLAPYIKTKPIHKSQDILREYKNGEVVIQLSLINNYELRSTLLGYGAGMEILTPDILREQMKSIFESATKVYK